MRNPRTFFLAAVPLLGALATSGAAKEWEWSYDPGTKWPEQLNWKRGDGWRANRSLEGGQIHFDSREPYGIWDSYSVEFPKGGLSPGPHETYVARARVKVDYVDNFYGDAGLFVAGDDLYGDSIIFGVKRIWAGAGPESVEIEPNVFHNYELRSRSMRDYELFVDGALAWRGNFVYLAGTSAIAWGDLTSRRGVSHFDYVSFAVVSDYRLGAPSARATTSGDPLAPEPEGILALGLLLAVWPRARSGPLSSVG